MEEIRRSPVDMENIPVLTGFWNVLDIPGGCLGFLPSTVVGDFLWGKNKTKLGHLAEITKINYWLN